MYKQLLFANQLLAINKNTGTFKQILYALVSVNVQYLLEVQNLFYYFNPHSESNVK